MSTETRPGGRPLAFALFTIIAGVIGWFASFELLTEYVKVLKTPDYVPNCNVSVLVTCGPNMGSWQGSLFGFSNTILGVAAFMAPILVGFALLAGARFAPWFWHVYRVGLLGGIVFVFWLFSQSVYSLGTLCPWCMVVWSVTIPLFWVTLLRPEAVGDVPVSEPARKRIESLRSWTWVFILFSYLIIAVLAQLRLDWLAEFSRTF
ncbi:vitamin K epoxide reductase family protein [Leucobacter sp. CSA2]|uniref:Vitamin K epoxide reductase family protein n=1 Tax=Leucobacter edaphi TaxID=2796472 RepID=A0A934QE67_9MICO|nr:vitamin K epoxide reductase family protein [Leucobacter edaphi]MBK0421462.1 vitamin K epoxide reductase family protein [Leucobacter edaphi]